MAPPREPVFAKDERALCFHHELLYEAKILDTRMADDKEDSKNTGMQYKIHYKGWKAT